MQQIMRCNIAKFPLKYLGLQLALRPQTKAEWQPLLDKVTTFVPTWAGGLSSSHTWIQGGDGKQTLPFQRIKSSVIDEFNSWLAGWSKPMIGVGFCVWRVCVCCRNATVSAQSVLLSSNIKLRYTLWVLSRK